MSLGTAQNNLRETVASLGSSVAELMMTVLEDRPPDSELAVVDHLTELVSELQAAIVDADCELASVADPRVLPERMPAVDRAVAAAHLRYWRDLRSHQAVAELRRSARGRGQEWRTWQVSVEESERRCEEPLSRAQAAVSAAWQEVAELLCLYLPTPASPRPASGASASRLSRTSSTST